VHQHRTGLVGNGRAIAGSSGGGTGADDDDGDRFQLMRIMYIPDQEARLESLQRYLAVSGAAAGNRTRDEDFITTQRPTLPPTRHTNMACVSFMIFFAVLNVHFVSFSIYVIAFSRDVVQLLNNGSHP